MACYTSASDCGRCLTSCTEVTISPPCIRMVMTMPTETSDISVSMRPPDMVMAYPRLSSNSGSMPLRCCSSMSSR